MLDEAWCHACHIPACKIEFSKFPSMKIWWLHGKSVLVWPTGSRTTWDSSTWLPILYHGNKWRARQLEQLWDPSRHHEILRYGAKGIMVNPSDCWIFTRTAAIILNSGKVYTVLRPDRHCTDASHLWIWKRTCKVVEFIARTYGIVVFDNEPGKAGVTQLHERCSLECNWVKPAESGSLSNTTTTYVLTYITHANLAASPKCCFSGECNISAFTNSHFIYFVSCWLLELGNTSQAAYWLLSVPHLWRHGWYCCSIVMSYIKNNMQPFHWSRNSKNNNNNSIFIER